MKEILQNTVAGDEVIIAKIVAGEAAMYEILIRRYNPVLYKIARSYGFNHHDAEDLMQETHVAAYQNLKQFAFRSSYKTWISKIISHKCLYRLNHGYQRREQPGSHIIYEDAKPMLGNDKTMDPEQSSLSKEFTAVLEKALQVIPINYRSVFVLREIEGFSVSETAEILNITTINVKVRTNRAKAMLQKQLEAFYASTGLYEFNLIYCDDIVKKVFDRINSFHK